MDNYQMWSIITDIIMLCILLVFISLMPVKWKLWPKETKITMIVVFIFWLFSLIIDMIIKDITLRLSMIVIASTILITSTIIILIFFYRRIKKENEEMIRNMMTHKNG